MWDIKSLLECIYVRNVVLGKINLYLLKFVSVADLEGGVPPSREKYLFQFAEYLFQLSNMRENMIN